MAPAIVKRAGSDATSAVAETRDAELLCAALPECLMVPAKGQGGGNDEETKPRSTTKPKADGP